MLSQAGTQLCIRCIYLQVGVNVHTMKLLMHANLTLWCKGYLRGQGRQANVQIFGRRQVQTQGKLLRPDSMCLPAWAQPNCSDSYPHSQLVKSRVSLVFQICTFHLQQLHTFIRIDTSDEDI